MKNSPNSYYISCIAWHYDEPMQKMNDFFFIKKDKTGRCVISIDIMQPCPHIFFKVFFFAPTLSINVPMFVFSPTCIRFLPMINAMINQQLIIVTRAVFFRISPNCSTFSTLISIYMYNFKKIYLSHWYCFLFQIYAIIFYISIHNRQEVHNHL